MMTLIFRTKRLAALLGPTILILSQYSCGKCFCSKSSGCKILTATSNNGSVVAKQIYCAQDDYYLNKVLQDSVVAFRSRYQSSSVVIIEKDSVYSTETLPEVKPDDIQTLEAKGYDCNCPR